MKKAEREFVISKNRPQVLFLGNGLCRAFGGMSWNGLLDRLKEPALYPAEAKNYLMPMPLKAAMLTNNTLARKMRNVVKPHNKQNPVIDGYDWTSFIHVTAEMKAHLLRLIRDRFDYVLTTNYSYEIEAAIMDQDSLSASQISKMMHFHEVAHPQTQFLINTFNEANGVPIWHVHGEARKPDSMTIGNYYYGKQLRRCVERLDGSAGAEEDGRRKTAGAPKTTVFKLSTRQDKPIKIGSWIDAFVLGDVYMLGFGLDFSETDIWWLLEYKANHRDFCGSTYYYDPQKPASGTCVNDDTVACANRARFIDGNQCRNYLLNNTYGITTNSLGIVAGCSADYAAFYEHAILDIVGKVSPNTDK